MNQHDFESSVLHLWMTTRVPLTRANLLFFTKASRGKLDRWLDVMVREGVLDIDSDDEGEMLWTVRGAARPKDGPQRVADLVKLEQLANEVGRTRGSTGALESRRGTVEQILARSGGQKNVLASGALSLLGPLGWLYAGSLREAIPAAVLYFFAVRLLHILPWILAAPLYSLMVTMSVVAGLMYAWQYNRNGHVTPLLGDDNDDSSGSVLRPPRLPGRR